MQSYADRYTHDFFFERDYPDVILLDEIYLRLKEQPIAKDILQSQIRMNHDAFEKALEKLWIHAGAVIDYAENIVRGDPKWRAMYIAQGDRRSAQIEEMIRYARSSQCRMGTLVRYFGDLEGAKEDCGLCDFCAPDECAGQKFRPATIREEDAMFAVLKSLRSGSRSTGKLHTELFPHADVSRRDFEEILGAMARAGLLDHMDAVFEKDGKQIPYQIVTLTPAGQQATKASPINLLMKEAGLQSPKEAAKRKAKKRQAAVKPTEADARMETALRAWRLAEAKKRGVPAFRILTDKVLQSMAADRPTTTEALLAIPGVGLATVQKYATQIYQILGEATH